ncbi:MAG TPA: decaprenyl-phosphate phosphoribosyltransferase [Kofleriaceae bacterium]
MSQSSSTALALLYTLRPRQWFKNLFVAAALVFAKKLTDPALALRAGIAVLAFCLLSGAVYAFNDVRDLEADRRHPIKRHRPIAAGAVDQQLALWMAAGLTAAALVACALISWPLAAAAAGYLVNNLGYSLGLKRIAFLDVLMIAAGFLLRVWAGALAIDVPVSPWLLACTGLLACLLGFGKRAHELIQAEGTERVAHESRASLAGYRVRTLRIAMALLAGATVIAYGLYTQDAHTVAFFGTRALVVTVPFSALGILRFLYFALWRPREESPTDAVLRDWLFLLNLAAWGAVVIGIIYGAR